MRLHFFSISRSRSVSVSLSFCRADRSFAVANKILDACTPGTAGVRSPTVIYASRAGRRRRRLGMLTQIRRRIHNQQPNGSDSAQRELAARPPSQFALFLPTGLHPRYDVHINTHLHTRRLISEGNFYSSRVVTERIHSPELLASEGH